MAELSSEELEKIVKEEDNSIKPMKEFESPEKLYQELIASVRKYHPSTDISLIEKAYNIAYEAHKGQVRKSGEPYIIHPLCVAIILAELELDKETIVAGILHDVVEDQIKVTKDIILIEGNWLLLKQEPWRSMQQYADYKILILAEEEMLKERLVSRKEKGGSSREEAEAWYQNSDSKNVTRVLRDSLQGDLLLKVEEDNDYIKM